MAEFEVNGITYKNRKLSGMQQLYLMQDLSDVAISIKDLYGQKNIDGAAAIGAIAGALGKIPRDKTNLIIGQCLGSCERKMPSGKGWAQVWNAQAVQPMFDDIGLMEIGGIVMNVLQDNFSNFLPGNA